MKFQADLLNISIQVPTSFETTALGAAYLAGIALDIFDKRSIAENWSAATIFNPSMKENSQKNLFKQWLSAVQSCLTYK
jgi:glycerol kinase